MPAITDNIRDKDPEAQCTVSVFCPPPSLSLSHVLIYCLFNWCLENGISSGILSNRRRSGCFQFSVIGLNLEFHFNPWIFSSTGFGSVPLTLYMIYIYIPLNCPILFILKWFKIKVKHYNVSYRKHFSVLWMLFSKKSTLLCVCGGEVTN